MLAQPSDFIRKTHLQRVEIVAGILDHLRAFPSENGRRATQQLLRLVALQRPTIMGADDRQ